MSWESISSGFSPRHSACCKHAGCTTLCPSYPGGVAPVVQTGHGPGCLMLAPLQPVFVI